MHWVWIGIIGWLVCGVSLFRHVANPKTVIEIHGKGFLTAYELAGILALCVLIWPLIIAIEAFARVAESIAGYKR